MSFRTGGNASTSQAKIRGHLCIWARISERKVFEIRCKLEHEGKQLEEQALETTISQLEIRQHLRRQTILVLWSARTFGIDTQGVWDWVS